ncbi:MAG: GntR family transcriptional regulator [Kiritimatiellae bacterium]|nr:GntR family transcriptional regulator [Kiritimatiellia bacterium]
MMDSTAKSRRIADALRSEIENGKFDATRKLPSEHQLMRRFDVARETVRSAIKNLCERKLVEKRPGYGTFLAERASAMAAQKFAVIVPDAWHPFYASICSGIDKGAKRNGWSVLQAAFGSGSLCERAVKAAEFAEMFSHEHVAGAFFQPLQFLSDSEKYNRAILSSFDKANIPVVLLDSDFVPPPQRSNYDLVGVDNTHIGYTLARHMIEAGARRIVYFSNPLPAPTSIKRGYGVGMAVTEAGLKWTRDNILFADPADISAAKRFFGSKKRPDAIIAVNDIVALLLLNTLKKIGVKVPDDVLLSGVNGDAESEKADPPITTVVQPCAQIGEMAVAAMLERLARRDSPPRELYISCSITPRASTMRTKKRM